MSKEVLVGLSPSQGNVKSSASLSWSPFDAERARRDLYYSSTCEDGHVPRTSSSSPEEVRTTLAKDLQEMEFKSCCGAARPVYVSNHDGPLTRQAASVTRGMGTMAKAPQARTKAAHTDRLSALRAELKQHLQHNLASAAAATAAVPDEEVLQVTPSPSYDRDIALSKSPSVADPAGSHRLSLSPADRGAASSPSPSIKGNDERASVLFQSTPSPSPEAARTVPKPHHDHSLVRDSSKGSVENPSTSHSLGYECSASRSASATLTVAVPEKVVPVSLQRHIHCHCCLVEDDVIVSHPFASPLVRFCPFCGSALDDETCLS